MTHVLQAADRNPVVQAEFHHQRFVIARGRVGGFWIFLAALLILPSLLMSLAFVGITLIVYAQRGLDPCAVGACQSASGLGETPPLLQIIPFIDQSSAFLLCGALLLTMMIAMSLVVTFINMALAANSIRREKEGNTWDTLRLTDIGPGRIVLGKWWASLRALNGDYVMTCLLRMGVVAFYLGSAGPILEGFRQANSGQPLAFSRSSDWLSALPLLLILTLVYSALDAALTAALGVFSALPDEAAGSVAGSTALLVRLATLVGAAAWMFVSLDTAGTMWKSPEMVSVVALMSIGGIAVYATLISGVLWVSRWGVG